MTRIIVFGCGGIGGYVGGMLTNAGEDVTMVDIWPEHVEAMKTSGLHIECGFHQRAFNVPVKALHLHELQLETGQFDYGFVCVKSYDTEWATQLLRGYVKPTGAFVSFQNGINEERLALVAGKENCLGCVIIIAAACYEPGHIVRFDSRDHAFKFGEQSGPTSARARALAAMFDGADCGYCHRCAASAAAAAVRI